LKEAPRPRPLRNEEDEEDWDRKPLPPSPPPTLEEALLWERCRLLEEKERPTLPEAFPSSAPSLLLPACALAACGGTTRIFEALIHPSSSSTSSPFRRRRPFPSVSYSSPPLGRSTPTDAPSALSDFSTSPLASSCLLLSSRDLLPLPPPCVDPARPRSTFKPALPSNPKSVSCSLSFSSSSSSASSSACKSSAANHRTGCPNDDDDVVAGISPLQLPLPGLKLRLKLLWSTRASSSHGSTTASTSSSSMPCAVPQSPITTISLTDPPGSKSQVRKLDMSDTLVKVIFFFAKLLAVAEPAFLDLGCSLPAAAAWLLAPWSPWSSPKPTDLECPVFWSR